MASSAPTPARRHKKIVVVMGPTGCGKTKLSIDLASTFFPSSEIINSDKIQVYRGLDITTNKIPFSDCNHVPHHLLGDFDPSESHPEFTPSDFRSSASSGPSFLKEFGYVDNGHDTGGESTDNQKFESAIKSYQENFKLKVTGTLDADTMLEMTIPRCGVADIIDGVNVMGLGSDKVDGVCCFYVLAAVPPKWDKFDLSYAFDDTIPQDAKLPVELAFKLWASVTRFTFSEKLGDFADMIVGMHRGEHGDGHPFRDRILAHAFGPTDERLHFNADVPWSYVSGCGGGGDGDRVFFDLESVALHEIGHVLGLCHSSDKKAIMYPEINPCQIKRYLTEEDIRGVNALYP